IGHNDCSGSKSRPSTWRHWHGAARKQAVMFRVNRDEREKEKNDAKTISSGVGRRRLYARHYGAGSREGWDLRRPPKHAFQCSRNEQARRLLYFARRRGRDWGGSRAWRPVAMSGMSEWSYACRDLRRVFNTAFRRF